LRKQLRPFYTPAEYARVYNETYNHTYWSDHIERVRYTIEILDLFADASRSETVADLSCGDGAILNGSTHPWREKILGDYTTTGPIEEAIRDIPHVDMFVLSETLEHMQDPDTLLRQIRVKADHLLLTTPNGEYNDQNPQHYWGWDTYAIEDMLHQSGCYNSDSRLFTPQSNKYYTFQVWTCM
jgi:hypothetical protein